MLVQHLHREETVKTSDWRYLPRADRRDSATKSINALRSVFRVNWLTPYQARIEDAIDLYPTNLRYFIVQTKERGSFPLKGLEVWLIDKIERASRSAATQKRENRPYSDISI